MATVPVGGSAVEQPFRRRIDGPEPSAARVLRGPGAYRDALRSDHWHALKRATARRSEHRWPARPPRCEWCRWACPQLQLHHRSYDRLGHERLRDVWLLCPRCHQRADRRRRERQARGAMAWREESSRNAAESRAARRARGEIVAGAGWLQAENLNAALAFASSLDIAQRPMRERAVWGPISPGPLVPAGGAQ